MANILKTLFLTFFVASPIYASSFSLTNLGINTELSPPVFPTTENCKNFNRKVNDLHRKISTAHSMCLASYRGSKFRPGKSCSQLECEEVHSPPILKKLRQQASHCYAAARDLKKARTAMQNGLLPNNDAIYLGKLAKSSYGISKNCSNANTLNKKNHVNPQYMV